MKLTTKLKQLRLTIILKCNTNVPGHREGGGGGEVMQKKTAHGYMDPKTYTIDIYLPVPVMRLKVFQF